MQQKLNTFQQVRGLSQRPAVLFSATMLERMWPNYQLFCELCDFEGADQARSGLNLVWEWLSAPKAKINFSLQFEKLEEFIPNPDTHDNFGVYPAIDFMMSLLATLQLILMQDQQGAVVVSKLSQGSVEAFIEATAEQPVDSADIKKHPLMQWEVEFQQALLTMLEQDQAPVSDYRQLAREEQVSNLGIEFVD